ncbi:MAG: replicative DNA helicase, partial [Candidatus Cryptobacteroides sp.]
MPSDIIGKVPPQALENEEAVLSAMLLDPSCVDEVMEELKPDAFYSERNRLIFEAMCSLFTEHLPIDLVTVSTKLIQQGKLESVGGMPVLADLAGKLGSSAYVETYVGVLKQKAVQRALITAANKILEEAYSEDIKFDDLVDGALNKVYNATDSLGRQSVQDIGSIINSALSRLDAAQTKTGLGGVPSGFPSLDAITNGWQPSDLIILAARPSVGKTAFALNVARNAAVDHHVPVAFFSLEMSAIQLANRLMVSESGLSADKIKGSSKFQNDEWTLLEQSIVRLQKAPLYVDETPGLPISEFRSKVKALWKQKHIGLVVVDYLQLMQGPKESKGV